MVDHWTGRLLDKIEQLGLLENTLVVLLSDHGYLFGEHGLVGKPWAALADSNLYDELARIPFMVYLPGAATNGTRLSALVQPIDLFPSFLQAVDMPTTGAEAHGASLLPLLRGERAWEREVACYGRHREAINVTDGESTLFLWPDGDTRTALYHVAEDPQQERNVVDVMPEQARRLMDACDHWLRTIGAPNELLERRWAVPDRFP